MQIDDKKAAELQTFVKDASAQLEKEAAEDAAVATAAPAMADYLIQIEAVPMDKRAGLIKELSNPVTQFAFMKKLAHSWAAYRKQAKEVVPSDGKTAEHRDAGGDASHDASVMKESDRAYYKRLGFTV